MDCESLETRKTGKWSWVLGFFGGLRRRRGLFVATALAFVAVLIATINIVGGFTVTQRMLKMFRKG